MLLIAIEFIYISIIAYIYGNAVSILVDKLTGYKMKYLTSYLWTGIVLFTIYAECFSLVGAVGLVANIILLIGAIILAITFRKKLINNIKELFSTSKIIGFLILLVIFSYGTSRGYNHYDTGLYHAQAIRWIEEYGIVKGLGLLHCRFGYNSAAFPISALFSFRFFNAFQSMHEMAGYFTFLLSLELIDIIHVFKDKKLLFTDIIRVGIFYYLTLVFNEIVSPASDYFAMSVLFFIILVWCKLLEEKVKDSTSYSLICVMTLFACSIKFSVCFIILLTIYPVILMIKEKKAIRIPIYLLLGFLVILPFFIRNIIISGRLLYPSTFLDIFNVDWKITSELANYDRMLITAWARGIYSSEGYYMSLKEWFPIYISGQSLMTKLMYMANILGIVILIAAIIYLLVKKNYKHLPWVFTSIVIYINFFVWFFTAPMVRYGYVYLIAPSIIVVGYILVRRKWSMIALAGICSLFVLWKGASLAKYIFDVRSLPYYIYQQPYEQYEVKENQIGDVIIYTPVEGDRTGYDHFPSSPDANVSLRGTSLGEGFKYR